MHREAALVPVWFGFVWLLFKTLYLLCGLIGITETQYSGSCDCGVGMEG